MTPKGNEMAATNQHEGNLSDSCSTTRGPGAEPTVSVISNQPKPRWEKNPPEESKLGIDATSQRAETKRKSILHPDTSEETFIAHFSPMRTPFSLVIRELKVLMARHEYFQASRCLKRGRFERKRLLISARTSGILKPFN